MTIAGWVLLALLAFVVVGLVVGVLKVLFRLLLILVVLAAAGWLYLRLRRDD